MTTIEIKSIIANLSSSISELAEINHYTDLTDTVVSRLAQLEA